MHRRLKVFLTGSSPGLPVSAFFQYSKSSSVALNSRKKLLTNDFVKKKVAKKKSMVWAMPIHFLQGFAAASKSEEHSGSWHVLRTFIVNEWAIAHWVFEGMNTIA